MDTQRLISQHIHGVVQNWDGTAPRWFMEQCRIRIEQLHAFIWWCHKRAEILYWSYIASICTCMCMCNIHITSRQAWRYEVFPFIRMLCIIHLDHYWEWNWDWFRWMTHMFSSLVHKQYRQMVAQPYADPWSSAE